MDADPDAGGERPARERPRLNTPDDQFVLDRHPLAPGVAYASACSGHGYKFAPVIGEILADLALDAPPSWPIDAFKGNRFGTPS